MEYRYLGASGLRVPALSFGTGTFGGRGEFFGAWGSTDVAEARRLVDVCLDAPTTSTCSSGMVTMRARRRRKPTGKIRRGQPLPENSRLNSKVATEDGPQIDLEYLYRVVDVLDRIAVETGKSVPQVALNWLLQRPTVSTVVIGARNEEQLQQNLGAVGWSLSAEQVARLDAASEQPRAYPYWHRAGFPERIPAPV